MKYIVDIKGEIEGDYEIIGKYEENPHDEQSNITTATVNEAIRTIKQLCVSKLCCAECPMKPNCNEFPPRWDEV